MHDERVVTVLAGNDYLAVRSQVLAMGVQALQSEPSPGAHWAPITPLDPSARAIIPATDINFFGPLWRGGRS